MRQPAVGANMPAETPLLLNEQEAAALVGRTARTWRRWDAGEAVPDPVSVGGRRYWRRSTLELWLALNCPMRRRFRAHATHADEREVRRLRVEGT